MELNQLYNQWRSAFNVPRPLPLLLWPIFCSYLPCEFFPVLPSPVFPSPVLLSFVTLLTCTLLSCYHSHLPLSTDLFPLFCCCCCLPTHPCLFGGALPYFEVTGHPVPVSSLGFKCPNCFIWNCSYIVYPSKMKGPFMDNCLKYCYLWLAFLMAGWVEGIRRALVLGLVLIAGTAIEHAPFVDTPFSSLLFSYLLSYPLLSFFLLFSAHFFSALLLFSNCQ